MMVLRGYMANESLAEGMFQRAAKACPGRMLLMSRDDAKGLQDRPPCSSSIYSGEAIVVLLGFIYIGFIVAVSL
jgi:hypothetical protein